jgi:hypothetical protein
MDHLVTEAPPAGELLCGRFMERSDVAVVNVGLHMNDQSRLQEAVGKFSAVVRTTYSHFQ